MDPHPGFNPHPREGGDRTVLLSAFNRDVSIRTPVKGVIWDPQAVTGLVDVSIRTPVKGVMTGTSWSLVSKVVSIRTPVKGVIVMLSRECTDRWFQSAPP